MQTEHDAERRGN